MKSIITGNILWNKLQYFKFYYNNIILNNTIIIYLYILLVYNYPVQTIALAVYFQYNISTVRYLTINIITIMNQFHKYQKIIIIILTINYILYIFFKHFILQIILITINYPQVWITSIKVYLNYNNRGIHNKLIDD